MGMTRKLDHTGQVPIFTAPALAVAGPHLRYYQREAIESAEGSWALGIRSILLHMATGTGKTIIFAELVRRHLKKRPDGRVLILCHRKELIAQTVRKLKAITGEEIGIEQGPNYSHKERIVVASVATIHRAERLERFGVLGRPTLIVIDEGHHYVANTYIIPIQAFPDADKVFVTATAKRGDGKALGIIIDEVAYKFDIIDGVKAGYLCPYVGRGVRIQEIDLSDVTTVAGDLHQSQLDDAICKGVESIVSTVLKEWPDRKGLAFFPKKRSARLAAERFNALKPGCAAVVDDDTPEDERRQIIDDVRAGEVQYLCSCMIFTEGFDWPECSLIINGRPTKSPSLYIQMVGRGARVLPGIVDDLTEEDQAAERRSLVEASGKPRCVIADFVGDAGVHSLVSTIDALGGSYSPAEVKKAKELEEEKKDSGEEMDPTETLEVARLAVRALAEKMKNARVQHTVHKFDPFGVMGPITDKRAKELGNYDKGVPATEKQVQFLTHLTGRKSDEIRHMTKTAAGWLIGDHFVRRRFGLADTRDAGELAKFGISDRKISQAKAAEAVAYLRQQDFGRKGVIDQRVLRHKCGLRPISEAVAMMKKAPPPRRTPPSTRRRRVS